MPPKKKHSARPSADETPRDHYPIATIPHVATIPVTVDPELTDLLDDDTVTDISITFTTDIHENDLWSRLTISGVGPGAHRAHLLLTTTSSARVIEEPTWDGDTTTLSLEYVPTDVIANVDGSDEIRFDITRKD